MIIPVILAGGSGTRLWPISRPEFPKQFAPLLGKDEPTLFQKALQRVQGIADVAAPIIICNRKHQTLVQKQLRALGVKKAKIIFEPVGRGTAPAVAIAALIAAKINPQAQLLILPADHVIEDVEKFKQAIAAASIYAAKGDLLCFGVVPKSPETGYGYIKIGQSLDLPDAFKIAQFVEKPSLQLAKKYLRTGKYWWNAGIFLFRADSFVQELGKFANDILLACQATLKKTKNVGNIWALSPKQFALCRSDSIDYAVMEHTKVAKVVKLDADWSDVGSWAAMWQHHLKNEHGNVIIGDVKTHAMQNSYVHSTSRRVVAVGMQDCVIIETKDAVLVLHVDQSQGLHKVS